jgi:hypothetical protein
VPSGAPRLPPRPPHPHTHSFLSNDLAALDKVMEEMSVLRYGLPNPTCANLVASLVCARYLDDTQHAIDIMRWLKFRPTFSVYMVLIGALVEAQRSEHALEADARG